MNRESDSVEISRDSGVFETDAPPERGSQSQRTLSVSRRSGISGEGEAWQLGSAGPSSTLAQYLEVPFIHKRLLGGCMLICLAAGWVALLLWPRSYESEAKLVLKVGRESVSLDPTATTSQTLMLQKTQEEEIISALEVLNSRQVAETVVDTIGEGPILDGYLPSMDGSRGSWFSASASWTKDRLGDALHVVLRATGVRDDISDRELAIRKVQNSVGIFAPKKSTVITIAAQSKSPGMAQAVAAQVTDAFLEQHLRVSRTEGSQSFFQIQSRAQESELNALMDRKSTFMKDHGIVSVDANRALLQDQLAAIDRDLILAKGSLEQATAEIEDLHRKIDHADDEIVATKQGLSDGTWSGMRQRVFELEVQEKNYAAKYTPSHQRLRQTREQLEAARVILAKLKSERVNESRTPNPAKRRMQEELQKQQTKVVGLTSIIAEKESQRVATTTRVNELHNDALTIRQMDRDIRLMETSLSILQEKQEEARVIDELQTSKISNVNVFQPATFVERPVSPKKRILGAGFVLLGLSAGIGLAFLREMGTTTLRTAEQVEASLRYPVISTIPHAGRSALGDRLIRGEASGSLRVRCRKIISEILLSRAQSARGAARGRTLGIIGIETGCGASTLASVLAMTSSDDCGLKTTLIDADAQNRSIAKTFGLNGAPGLHELVRGEAEHADCVQQCSMSDLELIACSAPQPDQKLDADPREIVATLKRFQDVSDLVVIDLPSASQPNLAVSLAQHLDHVIVVVQSERTEVAEADRLVSRLDGSGAEVVGVVLNQTREHLPRWIGKYVGA